MRENKMVKNKKAQEEMVGFALIIIVVAVIMLVFLGFSLKGQQKEAVENYEVDSFIQSFLQYTTDCRDNREYLSVQKLIFGCSNKESCLDGRESCEVLNSILIDIVQESWKTGEERPIKGYKLEINTNEEQILIIEQGNITRNFKGSSQDFYTRENFVEIFFNAYY